MKLIVISLSSMVLLAAAAPMVSNPAFPLPLESDKGLDLALDKRAILASESRDITSGSVFEPRSGLVRRMNVPNSVGTAVLNIGSIIVRAIVDAAGNVIFEVTNNYAGTRRISFRDADVMLDAGSLTVASRHIASYNTHGGIEAGAVVSIAVQMGG
ncbi:hypothetical protein FOVG_19738 [Fusarium oxysporum f. sp. pisi HDV247]|uniref:Uncharacterized protein n=1 Tax=Fusarium oxysporum f. sp. pisi HDV247 TaxID=1080344 RepID=W9NLA9_FUSOX|nr:hypothetical protein FOVG_19738 [Fusarium oxysporum f. sp. pisi HDV247]